MHIISSTVQNRWKDSLSPSGTTVRLTLRANGEEQTQVIPPNLGMIQAGFAAPTVAPTLAAGPGGGSLTTGTFVGYMYVYASSHYPFVDNAVTGGGELWPRSNPSPPSAVFTVTSSGSVIVTVTKTTRSDVDNIWIYRVETGFTNTTLASNALAAGTLFYVGSVGNDGLVGTATFTDTGNPDTSEILELDNYTAPTAQFGVFDGVQWWLSGNFSLDALVTLNNSSNITLSDPTITQWFSGRSGQSCSFDGFTTGGYDNQGTFYFQQTSLTTGYLSSDQAGVNTLVIAATGTTTIHIKGFQATLWRSKPRNPFSWGFTAVTTTPNPDGTTDSIEDPQEWVLSVGAGSVVALAVISMDRKLKLDLESPARTYSFDLEQGGADPDTFGSTKRTVDEKYSCGCHFSQFPATGSSGQSMLMGLDSRDYVILEGDGELQSPISDKVQTHLKTTIRGNFEERFWHGGFDPFTEFNCFWVKRVDMSAQGSVNKCDTLIWNQPSTDTWGTMPDFGVSASGLIYDPVEDQSFLMIGTESGQIGRALTPGTFTTLVPANEYRSGATLSAIDAFGVLSFNFFPTYLTTEFTTATVGPTTYGVIAVQTGLTPGFVVGDHISAFSINGGNPVTIYGTIQIINSSITPVTLYVDFNTNPTIIAPGEVSLTFRNDLSGHWVYATDPAGNNELWARLSPASANQYLLGGSEIDMIVTRDSQLGQTDLVGIPAISGWNWYLGLTPCYARRYFDLQNETAQKSTREVWATMQNIDPTTNSQYLRFYREYSTDLASAADSFKLSTNLQSNGNPSLNFVTKTQVPSSNSYYFGLEYAEFGFEQWKLLNSTIKLQPLK